MSCDCLRPLQFDDAPALLQLLSDELAAGAFDGDIDGLDLEAVNSFILAALICDDGNSYWAIRDADGGFAGLIGLKNIDAAAGRAEFCLALLPRQRGRGLARRATQQLLQLAAALPIERVYMFTRCDNAATRAFNLRCGFAPQPAEADIDLGAAAAQYCWYGARLDK